MVAHFNGGITPNHGRWRMNTSTFTRWNREFRGIATAVKKAGGNKITRELVEKIVSISVERIDRHLLATILEAQYQIEHTDDSEYIKFRAPRLYIVWSDGQIEKSGRILESEAHSRWDSWSGELISSSPWQEDIISQAKAKPIASHFVERDDVIHIILITESGSYKIGSVRDVVDDVDDLVITVYKPSKDFNLKSVALEIMTVFAKSDEQGLDDYRGALYDDEDPDALDYENS